MEASGTRPGTVRRTVAQLLSVHYGTCVRIAGVQDFPYAAVARYTLEAAGNTIPSTVIVRTLRDDPARSHPAQLQNERAALEFLTSIGSTVAPRFIAGDVNAGTLITEDLGPYPSLLDLLLGERREAARQGLLAFARSLGALPAQTSGRASAYARRRSCFSPADPQAGHPGLPSSVTEGWRHVRDAVAKLGLPDPRDADADVEAIARLLAAPGALLALSSGDPSPVNCNVVDGRARFFDFESAGFRHALIDATVLRYPYPTGGPVWRLPPEVADSMEVAYRAELARGCPDALDDARYESGMAATSAAWTILRMARLARVDAGPDRDAWLLLPPGWSAPVPIRSRRRQLVAILETCIASARRAGTLDVLAAWCERMVGALGERWPEATGEAALYPAFR